MLVNFYKILSLASIFVLEIFTIVPAAQAASMEYDYPELLVTPSASSRLSSEAKKEPSSRWTANTAIQVSSLLALTAGYLAYDDERLSSQSATDTPMAKWAGLAAMSTGGGFLLLTTALSVAYKPYTKGWNDIKGIKATSKRKRLAKERAAEERLASPAVLGVRIKWMSVFMNAMTASFVIQASEENETRVAGAIATLGAFTPILFPSSWEKSYEQHEDYKKRIYGPIVGTGLFFDKKEKKLSPGVTLTWDY